MVAPSVLRAESPSTRPAPQDKQDRREMRREGRGEGAEGGRRMGPPPGQLIDTFRNLAKDLNLSEDQKTKVEAALKTAGEEWKSLQGDLESMDPKDRRDKVRGLLEKLRTDVEASLNEEQVQALKKKMSELRPGGQRPVGEGNGPAPRPGQLFERLRENFDKLGVSEDQKKKLDSIFADAKKQIEEIRDDLMNGDEAARQKMGEIMGDARKEIGEVLTQEQRDKLRELMPQPGQGGPGGPGGPDGQRARRPGGPEMKGEGGDEMMAPEGKGAGGKPQHPDRPRRRPPGDEAGGGGSSAPLTLGGKAPAFELTKLDGKPVQLSSLNGRVGVIVFGSYSSPTFRQHAAQLESLSKQYGSRASFLVVYTKEAHPAGQWDVDRNKEEGISVEAAKDAAARKAQAEKAKESLGLTIPIAPDSMDDTVATAYGAFPNGAIVLSRDGTVVARQQWLDPDGLERRIEQALKVPATKPAL
jgi:peroxiredoxin